MKSSLSVAAATSLLLAPRALAATCREDLGPGAFVDVDCGEGVGCLVAQMDLVSAPFCLANCCRDLHKGPRRVVAHFLVAAPLLNTCPFVHSLPVPRTPTKALRPWQSDLWGPWLRQW
jgi:hypothetical protein